MKAWRARFQPPRTIGDMSLDAFVVEYGDGEDKLDFRFELGSMLDIYWALPAGRNDRLRLAHVDSAAYEVDAPRLIEDPWVADLDRLSWWGELAAIDDRSSIVAVSIEMATRPARYRCEIVVRGASGETRTHTFSWRGD